MDLFDDSDSHDFVSTIHLPIYARHAGMDDLVSLTYGFACQSNGLQHCRRWVAFESIYITSIYNSRIVTKEKLYLNLISYINQRTGNLYQGPIYK